MFRPSLLPRCIGDGLPSVMFSALLSLACAQAAAMELGRPQTLSAMGEPLSLRIPITLAAGETLQPECVNVGIEVNGQLLPDKQVLRGVEAGQGPGHWQVWVKTTEPVSEPALKLTLGCPRQLLAVLVDPAAASASASRPEGRVSARMPASHAGASAKQGKSESSLGKTTARQAPLAKSSVEAPTAEAAWRLPQPPGQGLGLLMQPSLGPAGKAVGGGARSTQAWARGGKGSRLIWAQEVDGRQEEAARALAQAASRAVLVQQTEAQLEHLRQQQQALNQELQQLLQASQAREARQHGPWWLAGLALLGLLAGLGLWRFRRH